jgi:hypothetical protein
MTVDFSSFEKLVNSECVERLGLSLNELPDVVVLDDYFHEGLTIKEAKIKLTL